MTGVRLVIGAIVMGVVVPVVIFLLLGLNTWQQLFTIAAATFVSWGVADLFAAILERPRLKDRSPGRAIREDLDRRNRE